MQRLTTLLAAIALGLASGCESAGREPRLGTELSFDGLVRVENARASAAWIDPDFDLSPYTKVRLEGAGIEFRAAQASPSRMAQRSGREFPLSEQAKERVREIVETEFRREMARSERFELTDESGPDVLLVWGGLLDVVSFVPPTQVGRGDIFLRAVGEATLVVELRDSQSNATLARIMDRRAAERAAAGIPSNTATNLAEVRVLASTWARLLRRRLDEAPTLRGGVVVE